MSFATDHRIPANVNASIGLGAIGARRRGSIGLGMTGAGVLDYRLRSFDASIEVIPVSSNDPLKKPLPLPSPPSAEARERIRGLELSVIPVAVFDFDAFRFTWANDAMLHLWGSISREALFARDMSGAPSSVITRILAARSVLMTGHSTMEPWTIYPNGVPTRARIHLSPIELENKSIGALQQYLIDEPIADAGVRRASEALLHTSALVALTNFDGTAIYQNPASKRAHDEIPISRWFVDEAFAENTLQSAREGLVTKCEALVRIADAERWHEIEARPVRDPVTSEMAVLFQIVDESARITARRDAEERQRMVMDLEHLLATVTRQQEEIFAISAPILRVGQRVVAVPIIGAFTRERFSELEPRLLKAITEESIQWVLLDFTGMSLEHVQGLKALRDVVHAIRLLGARVALSGVGPILSRRMVEEGLSFADASFHQTLAIALRVIESRRR